MHSVSFSSLSFIHSFTWHLRFGFGFGFAFVCSEVHIIYIPRSFSSNLHSSFFHTSRITFSRVKYHIRASYLFRPFVFASLCDNMIHRSLSVCSGVTFVHKARMEVVYDLGPGLGRIDVDVTVGRLHSAYNRQATGWVYSTES